MKISLAVLGLFLAFFISSQTPTSAFFFPPPLRAFCQFFPNSILCTNKTNDNGGSGTGRPTTTTTTTSKTTTTTTTRRPATSGNATNNEATPAGGQLRFLKPPY